MTLLGRLAVVVAAALLAGGCYDVTTTVVEGGETGPPPWWKDTGGGDPPPWEVTEDEGTRPVEDVAVRNPDEGVVWVPDVPVQTELPPVPDVVVDVGCVPGTECFTGEWRIMGSKLIIVVGQQAYNPDWFFLDVLPPNSMEVEIVLRSTGLNQLTLVDAFLEPGGNPFIALTWTSPNMPSGMPLTLMPEEEVTGLLSYKPVGDAAPLKSVLTVWTSEPDLPARQVQFVPKTPGPDIELPLSAVNYGCGSYCHGRDFLIENTGNKDLVISSMQLVKMSGEWTIQGAPPPGSSLPPIGSPGYSPFSFGVEYCDQDGSVTNDDNQVAIHSNDPDENPIHIDLHIIPPNECP